MNQPIPCEELRGIIENGGQLIDVRSQVEYSRGSLEGAINIPMETIPQTADTIDPARPVMLFCATGRRSGMVKRFLEENGFGYVLNIGGFSRYAFC